MLSSDVQQKIITALLKRPQNHYCADCNGKSPCWVSLDFGVFVCMNCSGAHRALGPSITRVRSTKLDTWNKDWVENMKIGNSVLNQFWEHELSSHPNNVKPNVNSSLIEIKKFVVDKYVKRKFVDPDEEFDPLTKVKKGLSIVKPEKQQAPVKPNNVIDATKPSNQNVKEVPVKDSPIKKHHYKTVKESTLPFNGEEVFKKLKPTQNIPSTKKFNDDLLDFHQNEPVNEAQLHQTKQVKKFDFNFGTIQNEKPIKQTEVHHESKPKEITFDNFLQNISNKSDSSAARGQQQQQAIHGNYFMSPQGFVNTPGHPSQYSHHGFSLPSHHHPPAQQQVTMNINMNMYPSVMNINMGSVPTIPTIPSVPSYQQPILHHSTTQNKPFQYNDFFTGNISPPPHSQNITLEVTMANNDNFAMNGKETSYGNNGNGGKEKSWVDDWM